MIDDAASYLDRAQPTTNKTWLRTSAVGGRVGVAAHGRLPPSLAVSDHLPFCRRFSCGPHQMVGEANVSCQQWVGGGAKVSCVECCKHVMPPVTTLCLSHFFLLPTTSRRIEGRRGIMRVSCIQMFTPIYMPLYMPLIVSYTQADT